MTKSVKSLLIITGTMGAGKSAVLAEASDILAGREIAHAAIDVDALGMAYLQGGTSGDGVMQENLRAICKNYAAAGVQRFLLARAIENEVALKLFREMVAASSTVVCRLTASMEEMQRRVRRREAGMLQPKYVARVKELSGILDRARLETLTVVNEGRPLTEVATEMLVKAEWIPGHL